MVHGHARLLRLWKRASLALVAIGFAMLSSSAGADPVVDFFKSIGRSMGHANQKARPQDHKARSNTPASHRSAVPSSTPQGEAKPVEPPATPTPIPPPPTVVREASISPETHASSRDIPYGIPVPNKPGFVTSPYAPNQGLVDVRGFRSGTAVKDPYTGKSFLTP